MSKFAVIIAAAGQSQRFQDRHYKKPFAPLAGKAVWLHSAERFLNRNDVKQVILVISAEDREEFFSKFGANIAILGVDVVDGGAERADSVQRALEKVRDDIDFVAVHDAARPCLVDAWIDEVFAAAIKSGAAILANPVVGTLKRSTDGKTTKETVSRSGLWEAQTPQVFQRELLSRAYAQRGNLNPTDEAQAVEATGHSVTLVNASRMNMKITTRDDLRLAEQVLKALPKPNLTNPAHPFADGDMWR
ncbi:MAG: 2-C-methyl-D-erythritol 4-phosphate cytidylyltransferase [Planctomycetales bacterium]|nr:2-C-methyl-D-erythritol 4-phosphate cytidylyltransferase [Planctomycetales bacterium]MCA9169890.1 2-C-methyl-D-erythritol 4-phosphate cytidylyltransferase [Planctomycetales bacterium]